VSLQKGIYPKAALCPANTQQIFPKKENANFASVCFITLTEEKKVRKCFPSAVVAAVLLIAFS
jgi:hypothetical protein